MNEALIALSRSGRKNKSNCEIIQGSTWFRKTKVFLHYCHIKTPEVQRKIVTRAANILFEQDAT